MRVNLYEIKNNEPQLVCRGTELSECFPDDTDGLEATKAELTYAGVTLFGGGACPLFLIIKALE